MRKYLLLFLLVVGAMTAAAKEIREYVVTTVPQMSCQNCEKRIKGNLRFEKGVKKVETDLKNQRVIVTYDADKTDEKKLEEAFGKLNYKVTKIEDCDDSANCSLHKTDYSGNHEDCNGEKGNCCSSNKNTVKKHCCSETTNIAIGFGDKKK